MADVQQIENAIAAHGTWKSRLRQAIDSGTLDVPVSTIQLDNQCAFGKWLHSLSAPDTQSTRYATVRELHAQFHRAAAKVAGLALGGKKEEAEALMGHGGEFAKVSANLTVAMMDWKKDLK